MRATLLSHGNSRSDGNHLLPFPLFLSLSNYNYATYLLLSASSSLVPYCTGRFVRKLRCLKFYVELIITPTLSGLWLVCDYVIYCLDFLPREFLASTFIRCFGTTTNAIFRRLSCVLLYDAVYSLNSFCCFGVALLPGYRQKQRSNCDYQSSLGTSHLWF